MKITIFLLLFAAPITFGQKSEKLNQVIEKLNSVRDYSASAEITADIPMIKILPSKATIYFKQKDKFKVESKGIALLPKQGVTELNAFLADDSKYMAIEGETEPISGVESRLITVIPNGDNEDIILAKIWIDEKRNVLSKTQMTTRSNGTVTVYYSYGDQAKYGLSNKMIFKIDVKEFKIPKSMSSDIHRTDETKKDKRKNGTITITLSNYKVNTGISDSIFKD